MTVNQYAPSAISTGQPADVQRAFSADRMNVMNGKAEFFHAGQQDRLSTFVLVARVADALLLLTDMSYAITSESSVLVSEADRNTRALISIRARFPGIANSGAPARSRATISRGNIKIESCYARRTWNRSDRDESRRQGFRESTSRIIIIRSPAILSSIRTTEHNET